LGFFIDLNLPAPLCILGSTQPLKQMSAVNTSWWYMWPVRKQTALQVSSADRLESWEPQTPATLSACPGV
jgi:hypothetical protein